MNLDSKLMFEAYITSKQQILTEAPIEMGGDINVEPVTKKTLPGQGKGYGAGAIAKIAAAQGKSEEDVASEMAKTVLDYTKEKKMVDGKEIYYFPGDPKTFINELTPVFKDKFGIPASMAGFTVNYVLIYLLNAKKTSGGLKMDAEKVKAAKEIKAATKAEPKTETVYEIDKAVRIPEKNLRALVLSLPDEDVPEREILSVVKTALQEYNETPGLSKEDAIKMRSLEVVDKLTEYGVLKTKQIEKAQAEGEGSGEVETVEDFPEGDDVSSELRSMGATGRSRGFDAGGFSFGD
jgi:hypothetical protein